MKRLRDAAYFKLVRPMLRTLPDVDNLPHMFALKGKHDVIFEEFRDLMRSYT